MKRATVHFQLPDGSIQRISPDDGLFYQASVSRSGREVVFYGARSGFPRLWRFETGAPRIEPLTPAEYGSRHPSFDWEGNRLTFASDRLSTVQGETVEEISLSTRHVKAGVQMHIYVCNADGSGVAQVTEGPYLDHRPSFSPDGRWIAFASTRSGQTEIWRVPADGSADPVPVTTGVQAFRPWLHQTERRSWPTDPTAIVTASGGSMWKQASGLGSNQTTRATPMVRSFNMDLNSECWLTQPAKGPGVCGSFHWRAQRTRPASHPRALNPRLTAPARKMGLSHSTSWQTALN